MPWDVSWDEYRQHLRAMCAFCASTCGIRAGRTPGAAERRIFIPPVKSSCSDDARVYTHQPLIEPACNLAPVLAKEPVHHFCALGQRRPDLMAVDQFRSSSPVMPGQQRDALHRNAIGG